MQLQHIHSARWNKKVIILWVLPLPPLRTMPSEKSNWQTTEILHEFDLFVILPIELNGNIDKEYVEA